MRSTSSASIPELDIYPECGRGWGQLAHRYQASIRAREARVRLYLIQF